MRCLSQLAHGPDRSLESESLTESSPRIPRIIHQSWRSKKLEPFQKLWQTSWLDNHADWTYMFWTDKENRKLVAKHFPWFWETYDSFPLNIQLFSRATLQGMLL